MVFVNAFDRTATIVGAMLGIVGIATRRCRFTNIEPDGVEPDEGPPGGGIDDRSLCPILVPAPWQPAANATSDRAARQPRTTSVTEIFVNYRSDDEPFGATFIDRELSSHFGRHTVFRDSRSIRPGEDFVEKILPAVRAAKVLLAVIGPRWLAATDADGGSRLTRPDDWVRREIAEAFRHGVRVVPLLLDAELPAERDLPAEIGRLARCQYVRIHHRHAEHDVGRLIIELAESVLGAASGRRRAPRCPRSE